jgi:hypothetical protein
MTCPFRYSGSRLHETAGGRTILHDAATDVLGAPLWEEKGYRPQNDEAECNQQKCALWDTAPECCSIRSIAAHISIVYDAIQAVKALQDRADDGRRP